MRSRKSDWPEIVRLTESGFSAAVIAERLGCSARTVIRVRVAEGVQVVQVATAGRRISAERLAVMKRLVDDGASHREIARTVGVTWQTVARHFPGTAWSPQEAGAFGRAVRESNALIGRPA